MSPFIIRAKVLRIANSSVMGQAAVIVLCGAAAFASVFQLIGVYASATVSDWGGRSLDVAWSLTFIIAFVMVLGAKYCFRDPVDQAWVEIGGIMLFNAGISVFIKALWAVQGGFDGRLFVVCMLGSQIVNTTARALLLLSRMTWVRRAANRRKDDDS